MPTIRGIVCASIVCALSAPVWGGHSVDPSALGFTDVTEAAGIDAGYRRPVPVQAMFQIDKFHGGGAVGDFDGDGFPDLFVFSGTSGPDRLYMNNGDGTFTDRAAAWGIDRTHHGVSAVAGDYNGDGHLDLYITSFGTAATIFQDNQHLLYRNNGDGTFSEVSNFAGVSSNGDVQSTTGACFGDYDLDGDLDLFVTAWDVIGIDREGHRLFRNNGDGTFDDVTGDAISFGSERVVGFTPAFADMNGDRYPELLLAADFWTSRYCVNNGDGTFQVRSRESCGVTEDWNGMGATIADMNGDGWLDWYISNIEVENSESPEDGITGQVLYINQGGTDTFVDTARESGVERGHWGWGTDAVDFNNDGLLDIAQTNGWTNDGTGIWEDQPTLLWVNMGDGTFNEVGVESGFADYGQGRGLVTLDYDVDGDMDIVVFNNEGPVKLFRNDLGGPDRNYIKIELDTSERADLAPDGFGSRVEITSAGVTQTRYIDGAPTFLSVSELKEHVGLGAAETVDRIEVLWNDGSVTTVTGVPANRTVTISPGLCQGDCNGDGEVDFSDLVSMLSRFGDDTRGCDADLSGSIGMLDLLSALDRFGPC